MTYKRALLILFAILFFLTALTSYVNRIVFPRLIKKIAIERIEGTLKRKVEIGRIHFSWIKGFVIDKIKLYERSPADTVFAQADQVSFGILLFPGYKHNRITIPYINVRSPSVHLIRTGDDTWNFSDMFAPPSNPEPASIKSEKPSSFEIAWGGITISNGKCLVNDISNGRRWSEFFDNINLKLSLSYKGISYDFTADIPSKKGSVGATVYYQPITKNTQATIHLKNIDTASYLSLINIPDVHLDSGIIKQIDLNIDHDQEKTSAEGDVLMENLNITSQEQNFKGNIEIRGLNAQYQNGDITARGQISLRNIQTQVPGLSAGGSIQARVNDFEFTKEGVAFIGSLHAQNIFVDLKDRKMRVDAVTLDNIKVRKDKDGIQSVGSIQTQGLFIQWPKQRLQGDITLKAMTMHMKDEDTITLEGEIQADHFSTSIDDNNLHSGHILLEDVRINILEKKNINLTTKLSLTDMSLMFGKNSLSSSLLKTDKLSFYLNDGIIKIATTLNASKAKLFLDHHKTIEADPQMELTLQMPLNSPQELIYKGSITFSDGHLKGFSPIIPSLDNVELDADFKNDEATINALSINVLDTNVRVNGIVKNFKEPFLNITADAEEFNLAAIKNILPQMVTQYGLSFNGNSIVKIKFEGLASAPLSAKILAVASLKNASITSSVLHQQIKDITGILEITPDFLKWRDTTATYMNKHYSFSGHLENFKKPEIVAMLDGPGLQLNANLTKDNQLITINSLTGNYMNMTFDGTGSVTLLTGRAPIFDINANASLLLEDLLDELHFHQSKDIPPLNPTGMLNMRAHLRGPSLDWKNYHINGTITSPIIRLMGYKLTDMRINLDNEQGEIKNLTFDGKFYDGTVHAVGSLDLLTRGMPYDLAFNIASADLHQFKVDSPFKTQELNGKFFFTTILHGAISDFKNTLQATGSLAIRDGYLGEFNLFKGLLEVLNDSVSLSKVMITDVEANFTIADQKVNTDNLRLKGPTIVLLGKGWVNFDQICDLNMTVDLSSGVFPAMAHDVLKSLSIRVYDKISAPKFKKKISVPQVINTLFKNLWQ